jgi:hypothetical protein
LLIAAALTIVLVGLVIVVLWEPHTLAKYQAKVGDSTIVLRITNSDGTLYATAAASRAGSSYGRHSITMLGPADTIGTAEPRIVETGQDGRIRLSVGKASIEYDPKKSAFDTRALVP